MHLFQPPDFCHILRTHLSIQLHKKTVKHIPVAFKFKGNSSTQQKQKRKRLTFVNL